MIPRALAGLGVEPRLLFLPDAHGWRTAWSAASAGPPSSACSAGSTSCTSATGCTRRSAAASARRWCTTSSRCASRSGSRRGRAACTCASTATTPAPATSSSPNSALHRPRRRGRLGVAGEPRPRRAPGRRRRFRADGERAELGAPVPAHRRDARAAQEPRHARRRARLLRDELALAVVGGAGWGPQPALDRPGSSGSAASATTSSRGSTAAPLSSSIRRASRASGCRSSRRWRRASPVVASAHESLDEAAATRRCAPTPSGPRRSASGVARPLERRDELVARGLEHARALHVASDRRDHALGVAGRRRDRVGVDVAPLVLTRAGTARYVRGLLRGLESRPAIDVRRVTWGGPGRVTAVARDTGWYLAGLPLQARRLTSSTARRSARRCARRGRSSSPFTTSRSSATRSSSPPGRGSYARTLAPARPARRRPRPRRLRVHEARGRGARARARGAAPRRAQRDDGRVLAGRSRRRGRLRPRRRHARAAQEPRAPRRGDAAGRRRAPRRRRARAGAASSSTTST